MARASYASRLLTQLNAYIAVVAVLLIFNLVLATRLIVAWHGSRSDQSAQYNADLTTYRLLQAQTGHLQGLPAQLSSSRRQAEAFVAARIPASDSAVIAELGALTGRDHVRLSRATYPEAPPIPGIVEMRVDANVTGEYSQIMHFINDLERDRDHAFFVIRSITLAGQQGGTVGLRIRVTTYRRQADGAVIPAGGADANGGNAGEEQ